MPSNQEKTKYISWYIKNTKRESIEWNSWDGTIDHGIQINNNQCSRLDDAFNKFGFSPEQVFKQERI